MSHLEHLYLVQLSHSCYWLRSICNWSSRTCSSCDWSSGCQIWNTCIWSLNGSCTGSGVSVTGAVVLVAVVTRALIITSGTLVSYKLTTFSTSEVKSTTFGADEVNKEMNMVNNGKEDMIFSTSEVKSATFGALNR